MNVTSKSSVCFGSKTRTELKGQDHCWTWINEWTHTYTHTTLEQRDGWKSGWVSHSHGLQNAGSFSGPWFTTKKRSRAKGELGVTSLAWNMNVLEWSFTMACVLLLVSAKTETICLFYGFSRHGVPELWAYASEFPISPPPCCHKANSWINMKCMRKGLSEGSLQGILTQRVESFLGSKFPSTNLSALPIQTFIFWTSLKSNNWLVVKMLIWGGHRWGSMPRKGEKWEKKCQQIWYRHHFKHKAIQDCFQEEEK